MVFLCSSVMPVRNSSLSTTRISQGWRFMPLGACMPQSRIMSITSFFTGSGLYALMLRRLIIVSTTAFPTLSCASLLTFWQQLHNNAAAMTNVKNFVILFLFIIFPDNDKHFSLKYLNKSFG